MSQRRRQTTVAGIATIVVAILVLLGFITDTFPEDLLAGQTRAVINIVRHNGEAAALGLLYLEESGVPMPVPGDAFVMYLGHRVAHGLLPSVGISLLITGVMVLGASNLFWISRRWGRRLVEGRAGKVFHATPKRLAKAEGWFARWGPLALIFGRHIPGFRVPITIAAGIFGVRYRVFVLSVAVSTLTWSGFFLFVGSVLGGRVGDFIGVHRRATSVSLLLVGVALVVYIAVRLIQLSGVEVKPRRRTPGP